MISAQSLSWEDAEPLRVRNITLSGRALLAPMAGVTDAAMRMIAERYGATATFSEMISSAGLLKGDRETKLRLTASLQQSAKSPRVIQIAARDIQDIALAAKAAETHGADWIDINMGCPCKRVTGGMAGSALMRDLDHATRLIQAAREAVEIPVSIKIRLGWDHQSLNASELAARAEGEGVSLITVHGRTRQQFYSGKADWRAIAKVASAVKIPVVANGDCASPEDAEVMLKLSGAKAVMIGRAALGRPWLVGDIAYYLSHGRLRAEPSLATRGRIAQEHLDALLRLMGASGLKHARKHLAAYVDNVFAGHDSVSPLRHKLLTTHSPDEAFEMINFIFNGASVEAVA